MALRYRGESPALPASSSATSNVRIWKMGTVTLACSSHLKGLCIGWQPLWGAVPQRHLSSPCPALLLFSRILSFGPTI